VLAQSLDDRRDHLVRDGYICAKVTRAGCRALCTLDPILVGIVTNRTPRLLVLIRRILLRRPPSVNLKNTGFIPIRNISRARFINPRVTRCSPSWMEGRDE